MTKTFFPGRFKGKVALFIGVGRGSTKKQQSALLLKVLMWYWLIL